MSVKIDDTYAEAFPMTATRLVVTAIDREFALIAANNFCGNASSVIGCDLEAGIECELPEENTPDGRPGVAILAFAFSRTKLETAVTSRIGQNVLTCPTTACFGGLEISTGKSIKLGAQLRYFGDGNQIAKKLGDRRYWRIPVMDGEFVIEDVVATCKGIGGGNLIVAGADSTGLLKAVRKATSAMNAVKGTIFPFPSGVVRSGSKVGSKYPQLPASTNHKWCPNLRGLGDTELSDGENAVYEIVIDGLDEAAVAEAMSVGLRTLSEEEAVLRVSAGNYGGKLGPHHFHLHRLEP